ncbi:MAG: class I SAM-dependent methyltransferase [Fervidobacterium sp.]
MEYLRFENSKRIVVTTSHNFTQKAVEFAKTLSKEFSIPYYNRRHLSERVKNGEIDFYYVVDNNLNLVIHIGNQKLFFHPGIAKIRMENYKKEGRDYLLEAIQPESSDIVYDGTFGLGMDAVFVAHFVGKVVGTEVSPHIYRVVSHGLRVYHSKEEWINNAIKKIELYNEDMKEFVKGQPDKSFDIVYCDPMFENPVFESSALNPIRPLASYDSLNDEIIQQLIRIAKKRVVIKSLEKDRLIDRLSIKFTRVILSRKNGLLFACIDLK